jgi:hypothetical protein
MKEQSKSSAEIVNLMILSQQASVELHSIETDKDTSRTTVTIENVGEVPAIKVKVDCTLFGYKDGQRYKPHRFIWEFDRVSRGNLKSEFSFFLASFFTPDEVLLMFGDKLRLPVFLQFSIQYWNGFKDEITDATFGYLGAKSLNRRWSQVADVTMVL